MLSDYGISVIVTESQETTGVTDYVEEFVKNLEQIFED